MLCNQCGSKTLALETRSKGQVSHNRLKGVNMTKRRRECPKCKLRFTSYEISDTDLKALSAAVALSQIRN